MPLLTRARFLVPAALVTVALAAGCGSKGAAGPSRETVRSTTAADVVSVLRSHNISVKDAITCVGQAPGIVDCHGTTTDNKEIQATLQANTPTGNQCTGALVVNLSKTQLATLPDEKCS